jgi:hypothetical protein
MLEFDQTLLPERRISPQRRSLRRRRLEPSLMAKHCRSAAKNSIALRGSSVAANAALGRA